MSAKVAIIPSDLSIRAPYARGLAYVMISRATGLENLYLIRPLLPGHFTDHEYERKLIDKEYDRLRTKYASISLL